MQLSKSREQKTSCIRALGNAGNRQTIEWMENHTSPLRPGFLEEADSTMYLGTRGYCDNHRRASAQALHVRRNHWNRQTANIRQDRNPVLLVGNGHERHLYTFLSVLSILRPYFGLPSDPRRLSQSVHVLNHGWRVRHRADPTGQTRRGRPTSGKEISEGAGEALAQEDVSWLQVV